MADHGPLLRALISQFSARAAGLWAHEGEHLRLLGFERAPDLPESVGSEFLAATQLVPLSAHEFGIVRAATTAAPAISRPGEAGKGSGSGFWLAAFGAAKSIAVPVPDAEGAVVGVVSVAISADGPGEEEVLGTFSVLMRGILREIQGRT